MKALREIGLGKALKYALLTLAMAFYHLLVFSPWRVCFLRLLGARIGKNVVLHNTKFFNCYRRGFPGLHIGDQCFIGDDCLFDLADEVHLDNQVTLGERVVVLTHINVGFHDHPLQKYFPASSERVIFEEGCFIGASVTLLKGVTVGRGAFVAAGSLVNRDIEPHHVVAGVPAKTIRVLPQNEAVGGASMS